MVSDPPSFVLFSEWTVSGPPVSRFWFYCRPGAREAPEVPSQKEEVETTTGRQEPRGVDPV